jgi:hypothetical protein
VWQSSDWTLYTSICCNVKYGDAGRRLLLYLCSLSWLKPFLGSALLNEIWRCVVVDIVVVYCCFKGTCWHGEWYSVEQFWFKKQNTCSLQCQTRRRWTFGFVLFRVCQNKDVLCLLVGSSFGHVCMVIKRSSKIKGASCSRRNTVTGVPTSTYLVFRGQAVTVVQTPHVLYRDTVLTYCGQFDGPAVFILRERESSWCPSG